ncbi:hypothetical protein N9R43_00500 [bacterium]|nr:hypothetical protein [bacterium]
MYTVEILKNKFWIVEDAGIKLGLIRKTRSSDFEVIMQDALGIVTLPFDALTSKYGRNILESRQVKKIESVEYGKDIDEVNGVPSKHKAFNKKTVTIANKDIPVYTKTEKSNVIYAAGYYGLKFPEAGWKNAYCVKMETLHNYVFIGPFNSKTQLEAEINRANLQ